MTDDPRKSMLKLLNITMLELMLLDCDGVNDKQTAQWITEEIQARRKKSRSGDGD